MPVWAEAITSLPSIATGIVCAWTGVSVRCSPPSGRAPSSLVLISNHPNSRCLRDTTVSQEITALLSEHFTPVSASSHRAFWHSSELISIEFRVHDRIHQSPWVVPYAEGPNNGRAHEPKSADNDSRPAQARRRRRFRLEGWSRHWRSCSRELRIDPKGPSPRPKVCWGPWMISNLIELAEIPCPIARIEFLGLDRLIGIELKLNPAFLPDGVGLGHVPNRVDFAFDTSLIPIDIRNVFDTEQITLSSPDPQGSPRGSAWPSFSTRFTDEVLPDEWLMKGTTLSDTRSGPGSPRRGSSPE